MQHECTARDPDGTEFLDNGGGEASGLRRQRTQCPCTAFAFVAQVASRCGMRVLHPGFIPHNQAREGRLQKLPCEPALDDLALM